MSPRRVLALTAVVAAAVGLQGCLAMTVTGAAVGTGVAVVKTTGKVGGAVVDAAIPDGDKDKKKKKKDR
jgi:hypothetical protein